MVIYYLVAQLKVTIMVIAIALKLHRQLMVDCKQYLSMVDWCLRNLSEENLSYPFGRMMNVPTVQVRVQDNANL